MPLDSPPHPQWTTSPGITATITNNSEVMATVSEKGEVKIDWPTVEKVAAQSEHTGLWAIATALLQARGACR